MVAHLGRFGGSSLGKWDSSLGRCGGLLGRCESQWEN